MVSLENTKLISFEIGDDCNLADIHKKCPISERVYNKEFGPITTADIVKTIDEAKTLSFSGLVGFQYYNEPLLYLDRILEVIQQADDTDYLLWTNGTLFKEAVDHNDFIKLFKNVVITCYEANMLAKYEALKEYYGNIIILNWELDNRKEIYSSKAGNTYGCMRPVWEIPIDFYGNVHLCCRDWNESYRIGNIKKGGLKSIIEDIPYQNLLNTVYKDFLDKEACPEICRHCDNPMFMPKIKKRFESIAQRMKRKGQSSAVKFPEEFII